MVLLAAPWTSWNSPFQSVTESQRNLHHLSLLFLDAQFVFCLLVICGFLCSLLPLSGTNSCSQCVLFSGMSCCLVCVAAALESPGQVSQGGEELERSHQCFPISPWKETSWQGRWGFGSFPWFLHFCNPLLCNPSASSLHLTVNDRKRVDLCKPAVPWQLCLGLVTLLRGAGFVSDISLPRSRKAPCEIQRTLAASHCIESMLREVQTGQSSGCQQRWGSFHRWRFSGPDWTNLWVINLLGSWTCCGPEVGLEASWITSNLSYPIMNKAALLLQQLFTPGIQWEWKQCTSVELSGGGWTVFARVKAAFIPRCYFCHNSIGCVH